MARPECARNLFESFARAHAVGALIGRCMLLGRVRRIDQASELLVADQPLKRQQCVLD